MKKFERVANYGPFVSLLEANGVTSKSEQLAIARMAVKALKGSKEVDKVIKEHLTFDPERVQRELDIKWLRETEGEELTENMKIERDALVKKYRWN